nr:MAG TPA: hypothetical protein [Caudoviricetes sp.]
MCVALSLHPNLPTCLVSLWIFRPHSYNNIMWIECQHFFIKKLKKVDFQSLT